MSARVSPAADPAHRPKRHSTMASHDPDGADRGYRDHYEDLGVGRSSRRTMMGAKNLGFNRGRSGIAGEVGGRNRHRAGTQVPAASKSTAADARSLFGAGENLRIATNVDSQGNQDTFLYDTRRGKRRTSMGNEIPMRADSSSTVGNTSPGTDARMEHRASTLGLFYGVVAEAQRHNEHMKSFQSRWIVLPASTFRRSWDILSLLLLVYVALFTPVQIAFYGDAMSMCRWEEWVFVFVLDRIVDAVFILDIFVNFRQAWLDPGGEVEFDATRAAQSYLRGWFFLDVVSVFPFDFIQTTCATNDVGYNVGSFGRLPKLIRLLRLAKIAKVLRMSRILRRFEATLHIKYGLVRLIKFFVWSLVAAHWVACAWFIVGTLDEVEGWVTSNFLSSDLHGATVSEQYLASMYWSVMTLTTIGYGDIKPVTQWERLFAILMMLLGSAMFAYVVGTMCSVVQGLSETQLAFQAHMDRINEYMNECRLPGSLRTRVRKYCLYQRDANLIRADERRLLKSLSPALRSEISSYNYEGPLRKAQYFRDAPREFIHSLSEYLCLAIFGPNEAVIRIGFTGSKMYILAKGRCQIEYADMRTGNVRIIGELKDGACFGELA